MRNLILVLGDQLDEASAAFDGFDPAQDAVWMAEAAAEAQHVWSHKARIAVFLAAMRHFRETLRARGWTVHYRELEDPDNQATLAGELDSAITAFGPARVVMVEPGEWRLEQALGDVVRARAVALVVVDDRHFLCSREEFARHAAGRKSLRMEFFYREMRLRYGVLLENGKPVGGRWNLDAENRSSFAAAGPPPRVTPLAFAPDAATREVLQLVERRFADHPGSLAAFDWPLTRAQAREALEDFVVHALAEFGRFQDAMWTSDGAAESDLLFHSRLSCAMNLKLLDPREVIAAAEAAWREGRAPLAAVEGFIRQILGWREYVRGIYWSTMPEYLARNALGATDDLPAFYWTGETDMACLREAIGQTLRRGYAHHIQRLMVTGLYALLRGIEPQQVHAWYLAVYVDAVEWVELPNTLGMSQYADGGLMGSKPYVASGKYIQRMSNYCAGCRYDPARATGPRACPFTTLYWDFLLRHEERFARHPRMVMQVRNAARLSGPEREAIRAQAAEHRSAPA